MISIIIPNLGRPDGLKRCLASIEKLDYPHNEIEVIIEDGEESVPIKVKKGLEKAKGEWIVYAANDMEFLPDTLKLALEDYEIHKKRLLAFDSGVRNAEGYICEHFMIKKDFAVECVRQIFDTDFHHCGVDDLLWKKCERFGEAMISRGKIIHHHFTRIGSGIERDEIIEKGWANVEEDRKLLKIKVEGLKIPKIIWAIWVGDPPKNRIKKCLKSQRIDGYAHHLITLKNIPLNIPYVNECVKTQNWVKAADYLRIYYLEKFGGIYLDADMEILKGKNFDDLLDNPIFTTKEDNNFIANSSIGSIPHHPILIEYLKESNKRNPADGTKIFEDGMGLWTDICYKNIDRIKILPTEYFLPYNHQTQKVNITNNTRVYHYFEKTWLNH